MKFSDNVKIPMRHDNKELLKIVVKKPRELKKYYFYDIIGKIFSKNVIYSK